MSPRSAWKRRLRLVRCAVLALVALGAARAGTPVANETVFESKIVDIQWLGPDGSTLLLQTRSARLHRSADSGLAWTDITGTLAPGFQLQRLMLNPVDSNVVVAIGRSEEHYISADAGVTWRQVTLGAGRVHGFRFHSSKSTWALLAYWSSACTWSTGRDLPKEVGGPCTQALYVTRDMFKTFTRVASHVVQFSWGSKLHEDRIYFSHFKGKREHQKKLTRWMPDVDFAVTDDFGQTVQLRVPKGNKFVISHGYILVATLVDEKTQEVALMVSSDGGEIFGKAILPSELRQHSYYVLDASEGAVVLHVNHGSFVGHLYVSDASGLRYSMSLEHNVRGSGTCAFEKVQNVRGIYIANAHGEGFKAPPAKPGAEDEGNDHFADFSTMSQSDRAIRYRRLAGDPDDVRRLAPRRTADFAHVRTVISFDKGGAWTYLKPPTHDSQGKRIECGTDCSLHLHDLTDFETFVPVYSYPDAVGIVMGTGNVGKYLSKNPAEANTYLSRDGGLTWVEAHKGIQIYEFGGRGGVLVTSYFLQPATQVDYTQDEGLTWGSVALPGPPTIVENVLTKPKATSMKFVAYGWRGSAGVLHYVDFGALGQRSCQGVSEAGLPGSDYEAWTPSDGTSKERCLLGHQVLYTRRKQTAECFNPEVSEFPSSRKNCACTYADYECEVGFRRVVGGVECTRDLEEDGDPRLYAPEHKKTCAKADVFFVEAYRLIAGDTCEGGWGPSKVAIPCREHRAKVASEGGGGVGSLSALLVVVLLFAAAAYAATQEPVKAWLREYFGGARSYARFGDRGRKGAGSSYMPPSDATQFGAPSADGSEMREVGTIPPVML